MAEQKETVWGQLLVAVGQGAGEAKLSNAAVAWLYDRYFPWLDQKSPNGDSPLEAWEQRGPGFLSKFMEIGQRIAAEANGQEVGPDGVAQAASGVEEDSDCPYCPNTPIP